MTFALTTRWNARRHTDGEAMIGEILDLGFDRVELGFDLPAAFIPGVRRMIDSGRVKVDSVHAYCPLPPIAPFSTPEPFTLADPEEPVRRLALRYLEETIRLAADIGARAVVAHAGNAAMKPMTPRLIELVAAGQQYEPAYEEMRMKLLIAREKAVAKQIEHVYAGVEKLMPLLDRTGRTLAFEILPTWEAIPTEVEMERLLKHFNSPLLRCWHDLGHGQIRENLGLTSHVRWAAKLMPWTAGMHIHDVAPPASDHLMPPDGKINFELFRNLIRDDMILVLEPSPAASGADVRRGLEIISAAWNEEGGGTE